MEFLIYEKAKAIYNLGLKIKPLPLMSWDIFSHGFSNIQEVIKDHSALKKMKEKNNWTSDWNFKDELQNDTVIVVTDVKLNIVFASKNIIKMNGYTPNEVVGKSPKMFQGIKTDTKTSNQIREAIKSQKPFEKVVLNYCKDGSPYKCHIKGYPVFNERGIITNFIAFEKIAA